MSNWEDKYNKYKDGGIDNELKKIVDRADTGKLDDYADYEYKEYDKLIKVKKNMPQVTNVVEYRDRLQKELEPLKAELQKRSTLMHASKNLEKVGNEIAELQKQIKELADKLKREKDKLSNEEIAEIKAKQDKMELEITEKQGDILSSNMALSKALGVESDFKDLSEEELRKEIETKNQEITKCNFVANMLVNGNDWDKIEEKLDNWKDKKFTSKDGRLKKKIEKKSGEKVVEEVKEKKKEESEKEGKEKTGEQLKKQREEKVNEFMKDYQPKFENYSLDLTFAEKHPRLAKIGNFFKGVKNRFTKKEKDEVANTETKEPVEKDSSVKEEPVGNKNTEEKSFKEYIRAIAEKGIDGIEDEKLEEAKKTAEEKTAKGKVARQRAAKEKLTAMRQDNRFNEFLKYGPEYAQQSDYRNNDEGR